MFENDGRWRCFWYYEFSLDVAGLLVCADLEIELGAQGALYDICTGLGTERAAAYFNTYISRSSSGGFEEQLDVGMCIYKDPTGGKKRCTAWNTRAFIPAA